VNQITQFILSYGGPLLFLVSFAEQSGLPFPGAPFLVAAGALAASGKFDLIAGIGWAAAGCVAADAIWLLLGHRGKARVFRMFPHLQAARVKLDRATLAKTVLHGTRMLTAAKFLPWGTVIPMHAGALEVGRLRFLLVDALSAVVFATVYAALGFAFHKQLEQVVAILQDLGAVSLLLTAVLVAGYVIRWFLKHDPKRKARPDPEKSKPEESICITSS
jgi:membrane protein DedA with SNARE-associated domain